MIAWARVLDLDEFVCALYTDDAAERPYRCLVTVDTGQSAGRRFTCRYSTDPEQIGEAQEAEC